MCNLKNKTNITKQKQTQRYRAQTGVCQKEWCIKQVREIKRYKLPVTK